MAVLDRGQQITQPFYKHQPLISALSQSTSFQQTTAVQSSFASLRQEIDLLSAEVKKLKKEVTGFIKINFLVTKNLNTPLDVTLEPDEDGYIARTLELPLYGCGDTPYDALEMLKREIESLYIDLKQGNEEFSPDYLAMKVFLMSIIADK